MAIVGVGVDAIEIERLRLALARTPTILQRLFTEREVTSCASGGQGVRIARLAARFAAKEAVAKAFGTGIRGFAFRDVEIHNDDLGRPFVVLHDRAAELAANLGVATVHVSLSTSAQLAIAHVIVESGPPDEAGATQH